MKLNSKSLSAKLYRRFWFHPENAQMPGNLCPYFWSLITSVVFIIPQELFMLPARVIFFLMGDSFQQDNWRLSTAYRKGLMSWIATSAVSLFLLVNYNLVRAALRCYSYNWNLAKGGILIDSAILLLVVGGLLIHLEERLRSVRRPRVKKPDNILTAWIKAKYNKVCPKITWVEPDVTDQS